MHTERLELGDGNWFELRSVLTRGMRKQIDLASHKAIDRDKAISAGVNVENPQELKEWVLRQPEYLASSLVDDALLAVGIVSFSYPGKESESLDDIPDALGRKVLERLRKLYFPSSAEEMADFFGQPPEHTSMEKSYQPN